MEITIKVKTAEEFRAEHAVIQINGQPVEADEVESTGSLYRRALGQLDAQRERITELENQLAGAQHAREIETRRADALNERNAELVAGPLRARIERLELELASERERAEENRAWAERAEGRVAALGVELADAKKAVNWQAEKLGQIAGAVHGPPILRALREVRSEADTRTMVEAIRQIRAALDNPALPIPAEPTTLQA